MGRCEAAPQVQGRAQLKTRSEVPHLFYHRVRVSGI